MEACVLNRSVGGYFSSSHQPFRVAVSSDQLFPLCPQCCGTSSVVNSLVLTDRQTHPLLQTSLLPDSSVLSPSHTQTRGILPSHLQKKVFPGDLRSPGLSETFLISRTCLHPPSLLVDTRGAGPAEPGQRAAQGSLCHSVSSLSLCAGTCVSVTRSTRCSSRAEGSWQPAPLCLSLPGW